MCCVEYERQPESAKGLLDASSKVNVFEHLMHQRSRNRIMSMKTRMIKQMTDRIKSRILKHKRCPFCHSDFVSHSDYISHLAVHPTEIIPNLFLGIRANALNSNLMNHLQITHIVTISSASHRTLYTANSYLDSSHFVSTHRVHIPSDRPLTEYFESFHLFIDSVLNHNEFNGDDPEFDPNSNPNPDPNSNVFRVLVVCESGTCLSPCFVAAYLISRFDISLISALNVLNSKRPIIRISNYLDDLRRYYESQCVQRAYPKKSWTFDHKIKIIGGHDLHDINSEMDEGDGTDRGERELLIKKRSITMKSTVSYSKSPKTGYLDRDSYIEFSHI